MISRGTSLLTIGASALSAQRLRSEVAANNMANVSTPGYARRRVVLGAVADAGLRRGGGVDVDALQARRQQALHRMAWQAGSDQGRAGSAQTLLDLGERALVPGAGQDIAGALSGFYSALRQASTDPATPALRQNVMQQAEALARTIRQSDAALSDAQRAADEELTGIVDKVNQLTTQIASLNRQVTQIENSGQPALDARAQRQALVDQLSPLLATDIHEENSGALRITLHGGPTLVHEDSAVTLASAPDTARGGLLDVWVEGAVGRAHLDASAGGALGGALEARDGTLADLRGQLDQFAYDLASAINAVHQTGVGLDGATGRPLFDAGASSTGAAAQFSVHPNVQGDLKALGFARTVAGLPGDNQALQDLVAVQDQALFGSGQPGAETLSSMVSLAGNALRISTDQLDAASARGEQIGAMIASVEGVSIEEELLAQAEAKRAFEAATRMIEVADDMFDTVLKLGGR